MREGGCGVVDSSLILDHSTPIEMVHAFDFLFFLVGVQDCFSVY